MLINGSPSSSFSSTRVIRQGDTLAPYLFIIFAEGLSTMIRHAERYNLFSGLQFTNSCPSISHLLFADDSVISSKADLRTLMLLKKFCKTTLFSRTKW